MKFNSDEIASVIQKEIETFESQMDVREVGTVLEVSDGIARVYGLSGVMAGEWSSSRAVLSDWRSTWKKTPSVSLFSVTT